MTPGEAFKAVERRSPVQAFSGTGDLVGEGRIISYSIVPTVTIERVDGSRFSWRHDMVAVDVIDQIIDEYAEEKVCRRCGLKASDPACSGEHYLLRDRGTADVAEAVAIYPPHGIEAMLAGADFLVANPQFQPKNARAEVRRTINGQDT